MCCKVRVKICCVMNVREAAMAVKAGADAIGLVGRMPSGPGVIDDSSIKEIAASVPPPVGSFLLTSETRAAQIVDHYLRTMTAAVQIVDYIDEGEYRPIRERLPWVKLVQVVHVEDGSAIERAIAVERHVDAILLDSGKPWESTKILGGTGKVHDWEISGEIVKRVRVPVFLAGGINPGNAAEAIERVHPYGIDVCSGVRTDGRLDSVKLDELFEAIKS